MANEQFQLLRECNAIRIPAGDTVALPQGETVTVTQALGGTVTVRTSAGMFRIDGADLDALGEEAAAHFRQTRETAPAAADVAYSSDAVWEALKRCYDPEIPVNIVDLGLIYDLGSTERDDGRHDVAVKMTLTARGCGMGPSIAADAKAHIESLPSVADAQVDIVWDPQWTAHMISPEGRKILGLD